MNQKECKPDTTRELYIVTWGKKFRKASPYEVEHNFDVCNLSYKNKKDINLKKTTGMDDDFKDMIVSTDRAKNFIHSIVRVIETKNLSRIGISCRQGKHRSVSIANYLKDCYYPNATVFHYEQKKSY